LAVRQDMFCSQFPLVSLLVNNWSRKNTRPCIKSSGKTAPITRQL
jgi:hypothetical protein